MKLLTMLLAALLAASVAWADGIWISRQEIMQLPMSGTAWNKVRSDANSIPAPNWTNQDNHGTKNLLAGAMVAVRLGDPALKLRTEASIMAHIAAFDATAPWSNMALSSGRQMWALIVAADVVGLESSDAATFRTWLAPALERNIGTHGNWSAIRGTAENSANNWGILCLASYTAGVLYLGDGPGIARAESLFRAYLGDRSFYPKSARLGENGYFHLSNALTSSCGGTSGWTGITPRGCTASGVDASGAIAMDITRSGFPPGHSGYFNDARQAVVALCEMWYRAGRTDAWSWGDDAALRISQCADRFNLGAGPRSQWALWVEDARLGTQHAKVSPLPPGYTAHYADWTHAEASTPPPTCNPKWIYPQEWEPCSGGFERREVIDANGCEPNRIELRDCARPPDTSHVDTLPPIDTTRVDTSGGFPPDSSSVGWPKGPVVSILVGLLALATIVALDLPRIIEWIRSRKA